MAGSEREPQSDGELDVLDPEAARRLHALTYTARTTVEGLLSGIHRSRHRGASVVFVEHRDYRPGDDLRLLDWRAFARTDRDVIKRFEQESQLRATLILDRSKSMHFENKAGHAAALLAALGYLLIHQGDATGVALFDEAVGERVPARSRPAHLRTVLKTLLTGTTHPGAGTNIQGALASLAEQLGRRGAVIIASDLLDFEPDALSPLRLLTTRGHDVLVLHVLTRTELELPQTVPTRFVGLEKRTSIDADPNAIRAAYRREVDAFIERTRDAVVASGSRYALCPTDGALEEQVAALVVRHSR